MKILEIINSYGKEFDAIFICEYCGEKEKGTHCHDDRLFHECVIPSIKCKSCGKCTDRGCEHLTVVLTDEEE